MNFNEYAELRDQENSLGLILEDRDCYTAILDMAKRGIVSESDLYNELFGSMMSNVAGAIGQFGTNMSNSLQQNQLKSKLNKAAQNVKNLQGDLKGLGFTDRNSQNYLTNIYNVLQTGLGRKLTYKGNTYSPNGQNLNQAANWMRGIIAQNKQQQSQVQSVPQPQPIPGAIS